MNKFQLRAAKFSDFFIGKSPVFNKSAKKKQVISQNELSDNEDHFEMSKKKTKDNSKPRKEQDSEDEKVLLSRNKKQGF